MTLEEIYTEQYGFGMNPINRTNEIKLFSLTQPSAHNAVPVFFYPADYQLWAMLVRSAILNCHLAGGCCRVWGAGGVPRSLVHIRLAHVTESGTRCEEEQVWEAAGYLPFSRARIGPFFQERPVLKNPFLEDALLRGYLRRHLPQDVRRKPILYLRYSIKIYDTEMTQDGATCPHISSSC